MSASKIIGIIYARLDSKRLPGKALLEAQGQPMLGHVIDRVKQVHGLDEIVLATSDRPLDNPLAYLAEIKGISVHRGQWENLAARTLSCSRDFPSDYFVRINGDSPWLDSRLIGRGIRICRDSSCDFLTNLRQRSYPYGIAVEILKSEVFQSAYSHMKSSRERENITAFFYSHPEFCSITDFPHHDEDLSALHLTVDTREDFEKFTRVLSRLGPEAKSQGFIQVARTYQEEFSS